MMIQSYHMLKEYDIILGSFSPFSQSTLYLLSHWDILLPPFFGFILESSASNHSLLWTVTLAKIRDYNFLELFTHVTNKRKFEIPHINNNSKYLLYLLSIFIILFTYWLSNFTQLSLYETVIKWFANEVSCSKKVNILIKKNNIFCFTKHVSRYIHFFFSF